jgi:hypothetical protein
MIKGPSTTTQNLLPRLREKIKGHKVKTFDTKRKIFLQRVCIKDDSPITIHLVWVITLKSYLLAR